MFGTEKVRNALRGLLQRYGTDSVKRRLWNHEYRIGRWNCLDSMDDDPVYTHIEKHAKSGDILDLGCGPGAVGVELSAGSYASYTGVDISDLAIEKAKVRAAEARRESKNSYFQSDILTYAPKQSFDVIFFGDSIYYFSWQRITEILARYGRSLKKEGVFIVRSWTLKEKHVNMVQDIENTFNVLEKHYYSDGQIVIIVFRPSFNGTEHARLDGHS